MGRKEQDDALRAFLERLRAEQDRTLPTGGFGRMFKTARSAIGTATRVVLARRGGGIGGADLETLERLVESLGELKGVPMKVGQILSYIDVTLPPESRKLLSLLQTQSQPTPFANVSEIIRQDLGERAATLLATMHTEPTSIASIGQVHEATLPEGTKVAVKVRHPGIDEAIRSDFRMAGVGPAFARLAMPGAGATAADLIEEARARMLEECDYALERRRQEIFSRLYAGDVDIAVPDVFEAWCGPRVLVTRWEEGQDFEAFVASDPSSETRNRIGAALFRFYVGTLYRHSLFHADPHPGNYRIRPDGRIVVFDYGCVREFDRSTVLALTDLVEAVRVDNESGIRKALTALGAAPPSDAAAFAHVRSLLRGFYAPMLRAGAHIIDAGFEIDIRQSTKDKLAIARLRLPGKLLFLFRIRFGLYAVLSRLGASCDWSLLERQFAEDALRAGR